MVAKTFAFAPKAAMSAAVASAMLLSATPADARDQHRGGDGIGAGEIIAGAVVLGGLAAILSSGNDRDDYRYDDRRYNDRNYSRGGYDYRRYGDSRSAVNQCVRAVDQQSRRYGRTKVDQITSIDRKKDGYRIKGRVVQDDRRGYGRDRYDTGKFTCDVKYGRIHDVKISGLKR